MRVPKSWRIKTLKKTEGHVVKYVTDGQHKIDLARFIELLGELDDTFVLNRKLRIVMDNCWLEPRVLHTKGYCTWAKYVYRSNKHIAKIRCADAPRSRAGRTERGAA